MRSGLQRAWLAMAGALVLVGVQQQLLLRRPPRLIELQSSTASSGPAALQLRFSRPMQRDSLAGSSQLEPALALRWLGEGNPLHLLLDPGQRLPGPLSLALAGKDTRGLALQPQRWRWDPRPFLLAVVPVPLGEQVQVQGRDGRWRPLSPVFSRVASIVPLGDGSGLALLSGDGQNRQRLWLLPLQQRNLAPWRQGLAEPKALASQLLSPEPLLFAHLSSNRRGDLLVQAGSAALAPATTTLWLRNGQRHTLNQTASGPMQLLPEGGGVVVPELEGLTLHSLPGQPSRRQVLPGSRDLSSFCPVSGRALLVRHWPDYRRSLELVEPGQAPRQLWLGGEAILASACDRGGERAWLLISDWDQGSQLQLLALDRHGKVRDRRKLRGWEMEPGTPMLFDATSQQLLLTLRPGVQPSKSAQPVLIQVKGLTLRPQPKPVRLSLWLTAG